jgi:hypothetical protein
MPRSISKAVIIVAVLFSLFQPVLSGELEDGFVAYKQGNNELAREKWLALAIKGDVRAQFFLSVYYDKLSDSPKDIENAKRWLTASANNGFVPAQFNIGNNYHRGKYGYINNKMAEYWWNQASMQGFPDAQYHLATLYYRGEKGVVRNLKEATYWFEQAAKGGHKDAVDAALLVRAGSETLPLRAGGPNNIAYDDPRIVSKLTLTSNQISQAEQSKTQAIEQPQPEVVQRVAQPEKLPTPDIQLPEEVVSKIKLPEPEQQKSSWVSQQPPGNYTIQLLASTIPQECKSYSNRLFASTKLETHTQPFMKKGKRYCAVIYGSYKSHSRGKSTLRQLPRKIRNAKPWIRKIAR